MSTLDAENHGVSDLESINFRRCTAVILKRFCLALMNSPNNIRELWSYIRRESSLLIDFAFIMKGFPLNTANQRRSCR